MCKKESKTKKIADDFRSQVPIFNLENYDLVVKGFLLMLEDKTITDIGRRIVLDDMWREMNKCVDEDVSRLLPRMPRLNGESVDANLDRIYREAGFTLAS